MADLFSLAGGKPVVNMVSLRDPVAIQLENGTQASTQLIVAREMRIDGDRMWIVPMKVSVARMTDKGLVMTTRDASTPLVVMLHNVTGWQTLDYSEEW